MDAGGTLRNGDIIPSLARFVKPFLQNSFFFLSKQIQGAAVLRPVKSQADYFAAELVPNFEISAAEETRPASDCSSEGMISLVDWPSPTLASVSNPFIAI